MRVFIVDDSSVIVERLTLLLEDIPGVELVGHAADVPQAIQGLLEKGRLLLCRAAQAPNVNFERQRFVRCKTTSEYETLILTPKQAFDLLMALPEPERTLTLLAAATGLRVSECLGLQWQDVDFLKHQIFVRRTWVSSRVGLPKSAASKAPVPMQGSCRTGIRRRRTRNRETGCLPVAG